MKSLEPLIIITGSIIIATISSAITAAYYRAHHRGQYNRGWNAARQFFTKSADL